MLVLGALAALSCGGDDADTSPAAAGKGAVVGTTTAAAGSGGRGGSASSMVMSDPRCPSVKLGGVTELPSCCDPNGQCGINAAMFGQPLCIELAMADQQAKSLGANSADYPPPRACDAAK